MIIADVLKNLFRARLIFDHHASAFQDAYLVIKRFNLFWIRNFSHIYIQKDPP